MALSVAYSTLFAPSPMVERRKHLPFMITRERKSMALSLCGLVSEPRRRKLPLRCTTLNFIASFLDSALYILIQARLSDYAALTDFLVSFSAKKDGKFVKRWSGELLPMAEKLLEHYAVLNNIDALHQARM